MTVSIPAKIRAALYIVTAVGTPVVSYLLTKGYIGPDEVQLWSAEVAVVGGLAAFKALRPDAPEDQEVGEHGYPT